MENLQLKDKAVLITGAATGIGKAVALLFAGEGADVAFIHYHDDEEATQTRKEISAWKKSAGLQRGCC